MIRSQTQPNLLKLIIPNKIVRQKRHWSCMTGGSISPAQKRVCLPEDKK